MHNHGDSKSAARCSRYCLANTRDKLYRQDHKHVQYVAPVKDCLSCEEDKKRHEEKKI